MTTTNLSSIYRGFTGSLRWLLTLGRFDTAYATSTLARFNMQPREGHLIHARRILGYLKKFGHGKMVFDTGHIDHSQLEFKNQEWKDIYPDAVEEIPHDMPTPKGKPVQLTVYVDADHAHDKVTRRSVTGIILFGNKTPLKAISKRQKTVETSTYGSELVAAKIAVSLLWDLDTNLGC